MKRKIISSGMCGIKLMILCIGTIMFISGCEKSVELDDREYILALGLDMQNDSINVTYDVSQFYKKGADSSQKGGQKAGQFTMNGFYDLETAYGKQSDKYLDLNHLKAVIIGKELAQNQEKLIELLQYIEKNQLFARNVKIFIAEDKASDIIKLGENLSSSVGEYLESMYMDSNYYVEEQCTDVGKFFSHWHNYDEILLIPVLGQEENKPMVSGYAVMQEVRLRQVLSVEDANLVFLGNGVRLKTSIKTGSLYVVDLDKVKSKISFMDSNGSVAEINIKINGHVTNQPIEDSRIQAEIESQLENQLEQSFANFCARWKTEQIDFFHTYTKLSSKNRKMWLDYRNRRDDYMKNLQVNVIVQVQLEDD